MSLRDIIKRDARFIIQGDSSGNRWPVKITAPTGAVFDGFGLAKDCSFRLDADGTIYINSREVSITVFRQSMLDIFGQIPTSEPAGAWTVILENIDGQQAEFSISETRPDATVGCVVLILGGYDA